jgi:tight adherence protein B
VILLASSLLFGVTVAGFGLFVYSVLSRAIQTYKTRYMVTSLDDISDMVLVLEPRQQLSLQLFAAAVGAVTGVLLGPVFVLVVGGLGYFAPAFYISYAKRKRIERFDHQLADALQSISGALRSGLTFRQAMNEVAQNAHAPLGQEFKVFVREMQLGTPLEEALDQLAQRVGSTELELFVSASQIAMKVGGNVGEMFDKLAGTLRERFRIEGRIRTLTAQGKLQGVIIGLMPITVWLGFDYFRPDLTRPMMQHWFGIVIVALVVIMELIGALIIRRIVQIEL